MLQDLLAARPRHDRTGRAGADRQSVTRSRPTASLAERRAPSRPAPGATCLGLPRGGRWSAPGTRGAAPRYEPDPAQRPVAEPRPAHQRVHGDRAVVPRIDGVAAAVAEQPGLVAQRHVLGSRQHDVAGAGRHSLDGEQPGPGLADDHDAATPRPAPRHRIEEQPIARLEGRDSCSPRPPRRAMVRCRARRQASTRGIRAGSVTVGRPSLRVGYFLVDQKMSANSLTAASSSAAAAASMFCLFLLASLRIFQVRSWMSG